ncbi:MAG: cytochrome c-type biogenesis protein CcmH [Burkholderiales bacterium]|nr:cytochrome c-type biogenesis protein CcmH [Burkholderiales bacterium]
MVKRALALLLAALLALTAFAAAAKEAESAAANPQIEARMMVLAEQLRCLVCQNQTIADSHADLAVDLRQEIREMLAKGMTEDQIRKYMTDRYGDFVLYKPPFKAKTALLWGGPPLLLLAALATLVAMLRRRMRASPDQFDPDTEPPTDGIEDIRAPRQAQEPARAD